MKKIIALALALIMALSMGSVAFAAAPTECTSGCTHLVPGAKFLLTSNTEYAKGYKVTASWTKGGALVDEIKYINKDKDDSVSTTGWYLILKENYTITTAKDLVGKVTLTPNAQKKAAGQLPLEFDFSDAETLKVQNHVKYVEVVEDKDDLYDAETAAKDTVYVCPEDENGYVQFNTNALLSCTLNMVSLEKAFMYNDESMIEALEEKFPEAEIECYNFGGQPTFKNAAEFTLQADYADQYYIYAYANGKLEAQDAEWDSIEGVYTWETKSPVSYVISDVELVAAADDAATTNPDTGANDVVGVAAALAVVSLVAAGAVSLKK